jgi:hypothetical protein
MRHAKPSGILLLDIMMGSEQQFGYLHDLHLDLQHVQYQILLIPM